MKNIGARAGAMVRGTLDARLCAGDFFDLMRRPAPVGEQAERYPARLGLRPDSAPAGGAVRLIGLSPYLNGARAVVTHTVDDATPFLRPCLDVLDEYGVKATAFVNTRVSSIVRLWPRLRRAVENGHEIGAHSRRHRCRARDTALFCFGALSRFEVEGSRDDILAHTGQPYVWTWAYPCGNCAASKFAHRKLALAGYIAARSYPGERQDRHLVPDLQTYDSNPFAARYTQAVQKGHTTADGVQISGRTEVAAINRKFDETYAAGGIYHFVSHPQMVDYGAGAFYRRHLAHIARHTDVWYVPMGPLYAYRTLRAGTSVVALDPSGAQARFAVVTPLDSRIYNGSVTVKFQIAAPPRVIVAGKDLPERSGGPADRWNAEYVRRDGPNLWVTIRPNSVIEFR